MFFSSTTKRQNKVKFCFLFGGPIQPLDLFAFHLDLKRIYICTCFYTQAILGHIYHLQGIIFEKLKAYFYIPPWVGPSGWTLSTGQFTIEDRISVLSDTLEQCEHLLPKISL